MTDQQRAAAWLRETAGNVYLRRTSDAMLAGADAIERLAKVEEALRIVRADLHRAKHYLQSRSIEPALDVIGLALVRLIEASKEGK